MQAKVLEDLVEQDPGDGLGLVGVGPDRAVVAPHKHVVVLVLDKVVGESRPVHEGADLSALGPADAELLHGPALQALAELSDIELVTYRDL